MIILSKDMLRCPLWLNKRLLLITLTNGFDASEETHVGLVQLTTKAHMSAGLVLTAVSHI